MANLYRKKSCLHFGDVAFRRFHGRKDPAHAICLLPNRNLTNNKPRERLLKRIRRFGS